MKNFKKFYVTFGLGFLKTKEKTMYDFGMNWDKVEKFLKELKEILEIFTYLSTSVSEESKQKRMHDFGYCIIETKSFV